LGKRKRHQRELELATTSAKVAERHGFDDGFLGHVTSPTTVNVNEQTALAIDTVLACVRILADLTADAAVGEFRGNEQLPDSRLTRRPMGSVTRRTWLWVVTATMALYNGVYLWRRFGRDSEGVPVSLVPVAPSRVSYPRGDTPYVDGEQVPADSLRWVPRMTFPTVTRELGTLLRLARETFAAAFAHDLYRASFWESGGAPTWYVTSDQAISNDDAEMISDRIATRRQEYPGRPMVLGKGAKPATLGADMGAAGASDAASRIGTSVARYFGVPPWLVNVATEAGNLTYANASAAGLDLVRYTLQPGYAGPIGDALSDELPGDYLSGRRIVLDLSHLTRGTILEQAQAYQIATGNKAWMLPSEVRADLHMPMDMTLDEAGAPAPALETIA
jgi:phage portal protein BeeE